MRLENRVVDVCAIRSQNLFADSAQAWRWQVFTKCQRLFCGPEHHDLGCRCPTALAAKNFPPIQPHFHTLLVPIKISMNRHDRAAPVLAVDNLGSLDHGQLPSPRAVRMRWL